MISNYNPDFKLNIVGCLEKYGDVEGALEWFTRAEQKLSDEDFIGLVDVAIGEKYRDENAFSEIFALREQKWMIAYGMNDIEALLELYRFDEAHELYLRNKKYLDEVKYSDLKQIYNAKQHEENMVQTLKDIQILLELYRFDEAREFYLENKKYLDEVKYSDLKKSYIAKQHEENIAQTLKDIQILFESYRFEQADKLYYEKMECMNETEYESLREKYRIKQRLEGLKDGIGANFSVDEQEALFLAGMVVKDRTLCNHLTRERVRAFIVMNLKRITFPRGICLSLLEEISNEIKKGVDSVDEGSLFALIKIVLDSPNNGRVEYSNVWTVFSAHPAILKKLSCASRSLLDGLADTYPFDNIITFSHFYLPPEKLCLDYLKNSKIDLDNEYFAQLKLLFHRHRYFNCEMVLALLKAKSDQRKIRLNDILDNLLKRIVSSAFNYNLESKTPIPNLIFPKCISKFQNRNFHIPDGGFIFCEGRRLTRSENGETYVLCRNRQCNEQTDLLKGNDATLGDNYFFSFLDREFGISRDDISLNKDFIYAMGAFNRWNEIAERLVCGYGDTPGCGSSLIYSKSPQVAAGRAAYATTYWRCSNSSCEYVEKAVKLSHCAGCHKIIDNRFDKFSCTRSDGKRFFICFDCGYCCDQHKVSGFVQDAVRTKDGKTLMNMVSATVAWPAVMKFPYQV